MLVQDRYSAGVVELAQTMAQDGCVWFVGAGFSIPSKLPGVRELAVTMLRNAVLGNEPLVVRKARYEIIKRALLGNYPHHTDLTVQNDDVGIREEIEKVDLLSQENPGPTRPPWIGDLVHLGRLADVLHRTAHEARPGQRDVELANLMGFDTVTEWDNEPSVAHHLMAMLIMEGLITQIITLNYDDQIERACAQVEVPLVPVRDRAEYRTCAAGRREGNPVLYKIHGCRNRYLEARHAFDSDSNDTHWATLVARCRALVVTDRQLQHWRDSRWAWAKDLFQDLLRWRPFMFIGFSASDLVLQATLNAVAEEVEGSYSKVFVAPSLSFPFYQFLSQMDTAFDPVEPQKVLQAYGQQLLPDLYPEAIAAHFAHCAADAPPLDDLRGFAQHWHGVVDGNVVEDAYNCAVRLLSEAARQIASEAVRVATPRDPKQSLVPDQYIATSTLRRMLHTLLPVNRQGAYQALWRHKDEYRRLTQVLAIMLMVNYSDNDILHRLTCSLDSSTENVVLVLDDPNGIGQLRRVVLVPESWGQSPTEWLQVWMRTYLEGRQRNGLLEEGNHCLVHACWMDQQQLHSAVDAMDWRDFHGSYDIEVFTIGDHVRVRRGEPVV